MIEKINKNSCRIKTGSKQTNIAQAELRSWTKYFLEQIQEVAKARL